MDSHKSYVPVNPVQFARMQYQTQIMILARTPPGETAEVEAELIRRIERYAVAVADEAELRIIRLDRPGI